MLFTIRKSLQLVNMQRVTKQMTFQFTLVK